MTREQQYILDRVVIDSNGCWIWQPKKRFNRGVKNGSRGYGYSKFDGKMELAHRFSFKAFKGPIPEGTLICHHCDVTDCVNPDHVFSGTEKDNMQDKVLKGRANMKAGDNRSSMTVEKVIELRGLRQEGATFRALGERYGITDVSARHIAIGLTWAHVSQQKVGESSL